jgi:hypothetical protein
MPAKNAIFRGGNASQPPLEYLGIQAISVKWISRVLLAIWSTSK